MRAIKKYFQYRRLCNYHNYWIGFYVFCSNFRKVHKESERLRKLKCLWENKAYHYMPYSFVLQQLDPEGYIQLTSLGITFE